MASSASILAAFGICLVLATSRRSTVVGGLAILAVSELLLAGSNGTGLASVTSKRLALALVAVVVLGAVAALLVRLPALVPPLVLVTAPIRLPLHFGGGQIVGLTHGGDLSRLLPLYLVLAAAGLALIWRIVRGRPPRPLPRTFAYPTAAFLAFASVSLLWSSSTRPARNLLEFFLIPFAVLVAVVAQSPFPAWMPRLLGRDQSSGSRRSSPWSGSSRRRRTGCSSTPPWSRSGTPTRTSSASPRSSAIRACTGATSCSGWRSSSSGSSTAT